MMSDEVYMTRTSNAINTETERRVQATQVIVNVTKKLRSTRIAYAIEYNREKMRYFKFTHIVETMTGPPIVNVSYAYQIIPTNKTKVRKIYCKRIFVAKIALSYTFYRNIFMLNIFRILLCALKVVVMFPKCFPKMFPKCHLINTPRS